MFSTIRERLPILKISADEWVQRMMSWHFSEETGCPFWLRKRETLAFDPLKDVRSLADLDKFGLFDKRELQTANVNDLAPRGFRNQPRRVFETAGTSGWPCRVVDVTTGRYNRIIYHAMLEARGLASGDAVAMVPSGPHAYGNFVAELVAMWGGNAHFIDFDPRWFKHLIRQSLDTDEYKNHLVNQTLVLLETQHPALLFTTSRLLLALAAKLSRPFAEFGLRAVCTGGTSCSGEEVRYLHEAYLAGVTWIDTYGNTLMGHALQGEANGKNSFRAYYLPPPLGFIRVVNPGDWKQETRYGERGRVLIRTLLEDLFIPMLLERDSAVRVGTHPWFPWDGVADIQIYRDSPDEIVEGIY